MTLTLINANRMQPPIAPLGLDHLAAWLARRGERVEVIDLCLADDSAAAIARHFADHQPELVGIGFRNVDDCFWPSGASFLPELCDVVRQVRSATAAPIVLGGVGYSIFPAEILRAAGAEFGIAGDGEQPLASLLIEMRGRRRWQRVPGLLWARDGAVHVNSPHWPSRLDVPPVRDAFDSAAYFRLGGQVGLESKRGCPRACTYCADPLVKGRAARLRDPRVVADELAALAARGIDVVHLCDAEFNLPVDHARAVCDALIDRGLGRRVRWYAYLAVVPLDDDLAGRMARAGCVGINFTSDSASPAMLAVYGHPHRRSDLLAAVRLCHRHGIRVMFDLLLGGPGETPETVAESIAFFRDTRADCVGAALGVRLYPGTALTRRILAGGSPAGIRRRYTGPLELVRPTFFIAPELGEQPGAMVRDLIGGDERFFPPDDDPLAPGLPRDALPAAGDHNYNASGPLMQAIARGARGAYWDILRAMRCGDPLPTSAADDEVPDA